MTDFYSLARDPLWQFVGAFVSVTALLVTLWLTLGRRKSLKYRARIDELVSLNEGIKSRVKVYYEGVEVEGVALLSLRFRNTGSVPIRSADFEGDIRARLSKGAVLLGTGTEASPSELDVKVTTGIDDEAPVVSVSPLLLNPGDEFTIRCLATDTRAPRVLARIAGVSRVTRDDGDENSIWEFVRQLGPPLLMVTGLVIGARFDQPSIGFAVFSGAFVVLFFEAFTGVRRWLRWRKRRSA